MDVELLRVLEIDLRERSNVVVERFRVKVDLLPATRHSAIDGDPVDAMKHLSADRQSRVRAEAHVERSCGDGHFHPFV